MVVGPSVALVATMQEHDQSVRPGSSRKLFSAGFQGARLHIQPLATALMNWTKAATLIGPTHKRTHTDTHRVTIQSS